MAITTLPGDLSEVSRIGWIAFPGTRTDTQRLDMASNTEIEKLERRWLENPLGLTFATLAEAYRKAGDTGRALEVLELGLAQHPNYVPAHIVRGRCHFDAQADAEAEAAFLQVLQLDHENVIALKGLAELSERGGRLPEAIQRLKMLIEVDRNNEEARGQLDRVGELLSVRAQDPPTREIPAPVVEVEITAAPVVEPALEPAPPAGFEENRFLDEVATIDPTDLHLAEGSEFQIASDAESLRPSLDRLADILLTPDAPILGSGLAGVDGLLGGEYASLLEPQPSAEHSEPDPPAAAAVPEPEPAPIVAEVHAPIVEVVSPPAEAEEPELVVTETMAEIFLRQGHRELALAVYQQLLARDPSNERIAGAVARLTPDLPAPEPEPVPEPVPQRVYAAAETGGTSVGDLLATLFKAQRPSVAATVHPPAFESLRRAPGEPTRPAEDSLSLSAVFGDEAGPAGPASPAPSGSGNEPSFDEFFAPATGASADAELPRPPAEAGALSAQVPEDLEQFNAWLRGLKR